MKNEFRRGANDNIIFTTSRCNSRCIMCCQPPTTEDDLYCLYLDNCRKINQAGKDVDYICITGGEPTLTGKYLFKYVAHIKNKMENCTIHILSNGRKFSDKDYLFQFCKAISPNNIVIGIPLHSDNPIDHDRIAGAKGSFYETTKGLVNLGLLGYEIELRVILIKHNINRLAKISEYISRNFPFVSQVSFMGLEITGFAEKNYKLINTDSIKYSYQLTKAVFILEQSGINAKIFNIPHCLLAQSLWPFACQSISDWKRRFLPICTKCSMTDNCCGLFSTSSVYSPEIHKL